jgi:hypothetical protein
LVILGATAAWWLRAGTRRLGVVRVAHERVLLAPRVSVDIDDVAVLSEAIDEGDDAGCAGEHGAPQFSAA